MKLSPIFGTFDRYIARATFLATLLCLILLGLIETLFTTLNELQELKEGYQLKEMLHFLLLDAPTRLNRIFPMALLLGCLVGLGQLSSNNELTAIRAAGFSKLRTVRGALFATTVLALLNFAVGEWVVPETALKAKMAQQRAAQSAGFWAISDGYVIQVSALTGAELKGVTLYEVNEQRLDQIIRGNSIEIKDKEWLMPNAKITHIEDHRLTTESEKGRIFPPLIEANAIAALTATPEELPLMKLAPFIQYLAKNGLDGSQYELAFWSKLFSPLTSLSMLLIASPLIFAQQRSQGLGARILIGIIIGLVLYLFTEMVGHFIIIAGYSPIFGALLPTFFAIGLSLLLFRIMPH